MEQMLTTKNYQKKSCLATVEALKALGVDANKIKAVGYGELNQLQMQTAEGKAQNRRVEAVMAK